VFLIARSPTELVVHAGTNEIFGQADADGNWRDVCQAAGTGSDGASGAHAVHAAIAQIDVEIFDLSRPIIGEGPFDAAAGGPAGLSMGRSHAVEVRLHIGESATGGEIKQHAIGGIAAPARCRQPIVASLATAAEGADARGGAGLMAE